METATERPTGDWTEEKFDDSSGIPGGAQPQDDEAFHEKAREAAEKAGRPPTPPADLPDDGPKPTPDEAEFGLVIPGSKDVKADQLSLKVGGEKPRTCVLKLKGGKIDVNGQFVKGDRLRLLIDVQITGDNVQDTIDKLTGEVKSTSKAQSATIVGVQRAE